MAAAFQDPVELTLNHGQNTWQATSRTYAEEGGSFTMAALAGVTQFFGTGGLDEAINGRSRVTGDSLTSLQRWGSAFSFGGNATLAVTGAVKIATASTTRYIAPESVPAVEDTIGLFHQGTLRGGEVSSTQALSTSLNRDLTHYNPAGTLNEFRVPRSTLNQWLDEGSALEFNDLHEPSGILTQEIRILPPASGQINQFLVPPAP